MIFYTKKMLDDALKNIAPTSIGQAGRISGVSPSDVSVLLIYMGRWKN